ncbi:amyloid beta A4 protein [Schistosoma bovis]|uniref:Amyloid beta A4 protein n=1 Tax=Schistosoma bovis TaxID=6184 RepID=A0A430QAU1_SCHBO|nr:amyloid beta A4 protein [Schistosoma bovis]
MVILIPFVNFRKEFWSKFIKLENQSERDRETLETIHHQRIEAQMLERRNAMQNAWEKAVNIKNPNNFTLFETLKRLFRVVEHDRSHYVKRFEHLRNMELPEAAQQLASIKDRLVELDILLNKSLEKINLHPELNSSLLTYANYLRNNKYRKLEAQSKAVLFADITLPDMIKLPTFQEQASLKAEKIIAKYHFSNSHQMKTTTIIPTVYNLVDIDAKSLLSTVDYSSSLSINQNQRTPHMNSSEITENKTTVQFGSYQNISVAMLHSDPALNTSNSSTVINLSTQIHFYALFVLFIVLRRYFASIRYNRKGYTLTVVEVDEVIAPKVNSPQFLPVKHNRLRNTSKSTNHHHHNDLIHNWQLNGYENPAYKFNSNKTDRFNNTNRYHHLGLFHQDNSFDDFEI